MKKLLVVLALSLSVVGCGPSTSSEPVAPPSVIEEIKMGLSSAASTGALDSGIVLIEKKIEVLKSEDAAKAAEIEPLFANLKKSAKSTAEVKKHANAILEKLK